MSGDTSRELSPYRLLNNPVSDEVAGQGMAREDSEIHLRDYWRVIAKHRGVVLGILFSVVATTAIVIFTMAPLYTATATIQIERQAPKMAPVQEVQQLDALPYDKYDYYQTQYEVLGSRSVAARVIRGLGLDTDKRFIGDGSKGIFSMIVAAILPKKEEAEGDKGLEEGIDQKLINRYLGMLSIAPVRSSRLVKVTFTSPFKELSTDVANRHIEEYVNASLEQRLGMTLKAKGFLESELAKSRDRVVSAEVGLNKFRKEKGIVSLDGEKSDIVSERLDDLNKRHTEAQADRIRLEGQYDLIKKRDYESLPDVVVSSLVSQLKQEVSKIEAERAELSKKFKPGYPKMAQTVARENEAKGRLNGEIRKIVGGIESGYLAAKNREAELAKQLEQQRQSALSQKDVGADYDTLKRDVDTARALYANLLQRLKDVDVAEEIKVSNVSVVDAAAMPLYPSKPKKLLDLVLATVIGLIGGVGMAFFIEYLDNTVKTPEDVERRLGLPTLGVVPSFGTPALAYGSRGRAGKRRASSKKRSGNGESISTELVVSSEPRSVIAEAYRAIRTGILLSSADNPPQVMLFTSGSAGEGKTVTAVNEAVTLANAGARVLLIDCDVRKPRLHRIFNLPNGHGLSTFLTGQSPLGSILHPVAFNGHVAGGGGNGETGVSEGRLFVIPSGPLPPNPSELLGSRRMRDTLEAFRQDFEYIVIDTPPVLPVTDAVILATMSDGVILVVRGQATPVDIAAKSRDRLEYARAKIFGVVLNDVDVTTGDYAYYHRYYYSYYTDAPSTHGDA